MKKLVFVAIIMMMIVAANAQTNSRSDFLISADNMKVIYIGIDNPLSIAVKGYSDDKIKIDINSGSIKKLGNGKYIVNVGSAKSAKIDISAENNGTWIKIGSEELKVKAIPDPKAFIAKKHSGYLDKEEILKDPNIVVAMENFDFFPDLKFEITEFSLATVTKDGDLTQKFRMGNILTDEMKGMIKNADSGQKFYIENIKAKGPDGSIRNLESMDLVIK